MNKYLIRVLLIIFIVHFLSNTFSFFIFDYLGEYSLEGRFFKITDKSELYISYFVQLVAMFFLLLCFFLSKKKIKSFYIDEKLYGYVILTLQLLYLLVSIHYDVNIAGLTGRGNMPAAISYFFVLFNVDILFLIYAFSTDNNKLKFLNVIVYGISMMIRGWMGGFVYILLYIVLTMRFNYKRLILFATIFVFLILCLPYIVNFKWLIRSDNIISINDIMSELTPQKAYLDALYDSISYILFRFQHLSSIIHTFINVENIEPAKYLPYWFEGNFLLVFRRLFSIDTITYGHYMVRELLGPSWATWNIHTGLSSWIIIRPLDGFIYIYVFALIFLTAKIPIINRNYLIQSFFLYMIYSRLFVGWFGAYITFFQGAMITMLIIYFISYIRRVKLKY